MYLLLPMVLLPVVGFLVQFFIKPGKNRSNVLYLIRLSILVYCALIVVGSSCAAMNAEQNPLYTLEQEKAGECLMYWSWILLIPNAAVVLLTD